MSASGVLPHRTMHQRTTHICRPTIILACWLQRITVDSQRQRNTQVCQLVCLIVLMVDAAVRWKAEVIQICCAKNAVIDISNTILFGETSLFCLSGWTSGFAKNVSLHSVVVKSKR